MISSGIRIGTPAMTTRGFKEEEFKKVGYIIATALKNSQDEEILKKLNQEVLDLTSQFKSFRWKYEKRKNYCFGRV